MQTPEAHIELTPVATVQLKEICRREGAEPIVRLSIAGRTCCGYQYGLSIGEISRAEDAVIEQDGVRLVIDAQSHEHFANARVDFVETDSGSGFVVNVPGTPEGCVCGGHSAG
jgi:iron-sulfur cluster assembly accessory protein